MNFRKSKMFFVFFTIFIMVFSSACNSKVGSGTDTQTSLKMETGTTASQEVNEPKDPFGKYSPQIEVSAVRYTDQTIKFAEGESMEKNIWTRLYESDLGIKLNYKWYVEASQYEQKLNVSIASNDLPDVFPVLPRHYSMLISSGSIEDLTTVFEEYVSPDARRFLTESQECFNSAIVNGKLMGIPQISGLSDQGTMLWIRTDWLKNLNMAEPITFDDVVNIMEAFATRDPDQNGKNDTFGLALDKILYDGYGGLTGFFNSFHAYPDTWVKDSSGKIVFGSILPEVKAALAKLQDLYKKGVIDREFGVKDFAKISEDTVAGRIGLAHGRHWSSLNPLQNLKNNDPEAEWKPFPLIAVDGKPVKTQVGLPVGFYYVVRKGFEHPEAVMKLVNIYVEKNWGKTADVRYSRDDTSGITVIYKYALFGISDIYKNINVHLAITNALKTKDTSKLDYEQNTIYKYLVDYQNGDAKQWGMAMVFGDNGSQSILESYRKNNQFLINEFYGAPPPVMTEKGATLKKLQDEAFTKIIMGSVTIDEFDKFVTDWKALGGDDITKEVNAWYDSKR